MHPHGQVQQINGQWEQYTCPLHGVGSNTFERFKNKRAIQSQDLPGSIYLVISRGFGYTPIPVVIYEIDASIMVWSCRIMTHWMVLHSAMMIAYLAWNPPAPTQPQLILQPSTVNLGLLKVGQVIEQSITVHNPTNAPIHVTQLKSSCGCTRQRMEPSVIPAHGHAQLQLQLNTLSRTAGPQGWRVQLFSDGSPGAALAELLVQAQLEQELVVSPAEFTLYGGTRTTTHRIQIRDLRPQTRLRVVQLESSSPWIKAELLPRQDETDGKTVLIQMTIEGRFDVGLHEERLLIHTDDSHYTLLQVPITIHRRGSQRYTSLPAQIDFRSASGSAIAKRMITIRDSQGEPIPITQISSTSKAITAEIIRAEKGYVQIEVKWQAALHTPGQQTLQIHLQNQAKPHVIPMVFD